MSTLTVSLFGAPTVTQDGAAVRGFVSSKALALLCYLAATGRAHTREAIAGLLWPDVPDSQALKNLRDVLSNLRQLLGAHLAVTRQTVALSADVAPDSRQFEALIESARHAAAPAPLLAAAVRLYRDDFLAGFSALDAEPFEAWRLVERERLRRAVVDALEALAADPAVEIGEATGYAGRALALDPLRESAHRRMMRLLAAAGHRAAALAQFETCRRILDDELGLDPDEETRSVHRQILDGALAPVAEAGAPIVRAVVRIPAPLTPLVGRARELEQIAAWVCDPACRLITLVGMGGVGKTRLAIEAARGLASASQRGERFRHGVVFVDLAGVEAPAEAARGQTPPALAGQVADALGVSPTEQGSPDAQLASYLHEKELLLVLDNCEHLPAVEFILGLLHGAPHLVVLATSRVRLNVRGEQVIELEGLSFPDGAAGAARSDWARYEAIQLFRRSAQAANPRQTWSGAEFEAAARICALVDGLPLGVELAASLTRLMPVAEIAREIAGDPGVLQGARGDLPDRHRSLQAVFDHSWRLLGAEEQRGILRLSVFPGAFSRQAAHAAGVPTALLGRLLDSSLVRRAGSGQDGGRYTLLDLVRRAAAAELERDADERRAARERHGRYYLELVARRAAEMRGSSQQQVLGAVYLELDNIRAAWRWALAARQADLIRLAADGLFYLCEMRSRFADGRQLFEEAARAAAERYAAAPGPEAGALWGALLARQGWLEIQVGRQAAGRDLLTESARLLDEAGAAGERHFPLSYLAAATSYTGDYDAARRLAEEALALAQAAGDEHACAVAKTILGQIAYLVGRYDESRRHSLESLALERRLGNYWGTVFTLISLGRVAQAQGEHAEAQRYFQEGLLIRLAMRDTRGVALCLSDLGDTAAARGDHTEARWCYQESLALFDEIGSAWGAATARTKLGHNALARKDSAAARRHFLAALDVGRRMQVPPLALAALAGLATALAASDPAVARAAAAVVTSHAAADRASYELADAVLARQLGAPPEPPPALDALVVELLGAA